MKYLRSHYQNVFRFIATYTCTTQLHHDIMHQVSRVALKACAQNIFIQYPTGKIRALAITMSSLAQRNMKPIQEKWMSMKLHVCLHSFRSTMHRTIMPVLLSDGLIKSEMALMRTLACGKFVLQPLPTAHSISPSSMLRKYTMLLILFLSMEIGQSHRVSLP